MKRICWKNGMKLDKDLFRRSDEATMEMIGKACAMAAAGRMGLMPYGKTFEAIVSFGRNYVEVEAITCLAITRDGHVIDVDYDTDFTNTIGKTVEMPDNGDECLLAVRANYDEWHETTNDYEVPDYGFMVLKPNIELPDDAFPIAHIVKENGVWKVDDENFVPPCLFLSAHPKYEELRKQVEERLKKTDEMMTEQKGEARKVFASAFWPVVRQLLVTVDKEKDLMTPMGLLAVLQQYVSVFVCVCYMEGFNFDENDTVKFENFIRAPYTWEKAYERILEGLGLASYIFEEKLPKIVQAEKKRQEPPKTETRRQKYSEFPSAPEPPDIDESYFQIKCKNSTTAIPLVHIQPNTTVWFKVTGANGKDDGMKKRAQGNRISFDNGFTQEIGKAGETKEVELVLWTEKNGQNSARNTFSVVLIKSVAFEDVPKI